MYVKLYHSGYTQKGEQFSQGIFLLLASGGRDKVSGQGKGTFPDVERIYACLRYVSLRQVGHFMMGTARIGGESITVSGAYGHDGLPLDYDMMSAKVQSYFIPLSNEDTLAFWYPEHQEHNSAGSEGIRMREVGLMNHQGTYPKVEVKK